MRPAIRRVVLIVLGLAGTLELLSCIPKPQPVLRTEYELSSPTLRVAGNRLVLVLKKPGEWDATANQLIYGFYTSELTPDPATAPAAFKARTDALRAQGDPWAIYLGDRLDVLAASPVANRTTLMNALLARQGQMDPGASYLAQLFNETMLLGQSKFRPFAAFNPTFFAQFPPGFRANWQIRTMAPAAGAEFRFVDNHHSTAPAIPALTNPDLVWKNRWIQAGLTNQTTTPPVFNLKATAVDSRTVKVTWQGPCNQSRNPPNAKRYFLGVITARPGGGFGALSSPAIQCNLYANGGHPVNNFGPQSCASEYAVTDVVRPGEKYIYFVYVESGTPTDAAVNPSTGEWYGPLQTALAVTYRSPDQPFTGLGAGSGNNPYPFGYDSKFVVRWETPSAGPDPAMPASLTVLTVIKRRDLTICSSTGPCPTEVTFTAPNTPSTNSCLDGSFNGTFTDDTLRGRPGNYLYTITATAAWTNHNHGTPAAPTQQIGFSVEFRRPPPVAGFADLHVHQFANLAHGGRVLAGRSGDSDDGSGFYDGSLYYNPPNVWGTSGGFFGNATSAALKDCGSWGTRQHSISRFFDIFIGHGFHGYPAFDDWPSRNSDVHQQVYKTWLQRAWEGGLRLMVMHAVNTEFLCKAVSTLSGGQSRIDCRDTPAADLQITAAYRFQEEIDNENGCSNRNTVNPFGCGWYRIVTTPEEARAAIGAGKLAVVLGLELDTPFGCGTGTVRAWAGGGPGGWPGVAGTRPTCTVSSVTDASIPGSLQYFYNRGVRHVFPIHLINNGLGSTAASNGLFNVMNERMNGSYYNVEQCPTPIPTIPPETPYATVVDAGPTFAGISLAGITVGSPPLPPGYSAGMTATCNRGGPFGATTPIGLTPLGRSVILEMMRLGMLIDVDHMSDRAHADLVALSRANNNYPLVSGHTTLNAIAVSAGERNEGSLSDAQLNEVRASGGLVALNVSHKQNAVDPANPGKEGVISQWVRTTTGGTVTHDCDGSTKSWAQQYLATVDKSRQAPLPSDVTSLGAVVGVAFGSDFNTISTMTQPRFGYETGPVGCSGNVNQALNQLSPTAVQYDVDVDGGPPTMPGLGGIDTSLKADAATGFAGFNGPILARSRINEGGGVFMLFSPDTPSGGAVPECLDANGDGGGQWAKIADCGDGTWRDQQWTYTASDSTLRPWVVNGARSARGLAPLCLEAYLHRAQLG